MKYRVLSTFAAVVFAGCSSSVAVESTVMPQAVEVAPPDWPHLQKIYTGQRYAIGGYPVEAEFGSNVNGIVQGIVGAVQIPSEMVAPNHSAGVAGYARTSSVNNMAVGIHGFGGVTANNGQAEGGHFLTTNCGFQYCQVGFDASNNYIIEADINMMKTSRGDDPAGNAFGIILLGGGNATPKGLFQAIHVDSPGVFASPVVAWKEGLAIVDGAATVGISLGKQHIATSSNSQPILLHSSSNGNSEVSALQGQAGGDVVITAGSGATVLQGWGLRITDSRTPASSTTACLRGQIQWDANYTYVCVAANQWRRSPLADF